MSLYVIGDVQGCLDPLKKLLEKIKFDPSKDFIWFVGDLINRGPKSLETLRFIKNLPRSNSVLGNHDVAGMGYLLGAYPQNAHRFNINDIINAPDKEELILWYTNRPLLHVEGNKAIVHAGIYPVWNLEQAQEQAHFFEKYLKNNLNPEFYSHLMGAEPSLWQENLGLQDRLRFIYNSFARMRYCRPDGSLEMKHKGYENRTEEKDRETDTLIPWFQMPNRRTKEVQIFFGHWSALKGITQTPNTYATDTGCVWGEDLTAVNTDTLDIFSVKNI
ncbi:MAG: symmetrical bis(5'-nucleosyl)-tetraphosphatase [Gammaproteobacteria bacterium]